MSRARLFELTERSPDKPRREPRVKRSDHTELPKGRNGARPASGKEYRWPRKPSRPTGRLDINDGIPGYEMHSRVPPRFLGESTSNLPVTHGSRRGFRRPRVNGLTSFQEPEFPLYLTLFPALRERRLSSTTRKPYAPGRIHSRCGDDGRSY